MDATTNDRSLYSDYADPHQSEYVQPADVRPPIGVADVLGALRRRWRFPLVGFLIGLTVAVGYVVVVKTPYKSSARILIDRSMNRYLQTSKLVDQPTLDDTDISSQIYVLSSDSVVVPVVRSLNLAHDSELVPRRFAGFPIVDTTHAAEPDGPLERRAVESVLRRLTVVREDVANVINVSFESANPNKAAEIANAVADTYIATTLDAKMKSTKVVSQWLQDRLIELKQQVADADRALQEYKTANNLPNDGKGTLDSEYISNIRNQLASARVAVAEAKVRLDRIQRANGEGALTALSTDALNNPARSGIINFALNNSDLVKLRAQYRDLEARAAEVASRVGPKHAAAAKLHEQLATLLRAIRAEETRISDTYASEYQIAVARESELAANAAKLLGGTEASSQVRELENAAETLHSLYNGFLQKYKEINATQAETLPLQMAQIITRAAPPLHKSSKKAIAVFGGSLMLGLLFGAGAALGLEWKADVMRTPAAVEHVTGKACVVLPMVDPTSTPIAEQVLAAPFSRFAESLRGIKVAIDSALPPNGAKVIGIVSSAPKEGKTVVAANLAALAIAASGARTLIIDSDLHLRNLTNELAPDAREGLIEALDDPSRLASLVVKRASSGLDVLPCVSATRIPNAAELLGSRKMEQLLAAARDSYDYIIIEIAPIMSVIDVKTIERFIDVFVFVVEWAETKRTLVAEALSSAQVIRERLVAVVLNKMDPHALRTIESNKGRRADDYYRD